MRSKSEVIIADLLYAKGIDYAYERPFYGKEGSRRVPDFTIEDAETGATVYWEHLGLLTDPTYRQRWERKQEWYAKQGIVEGGGSAGRLVITKDDLRGGINSAEIEQVIGEVFRV